MSGSDQRVEKYSPKKISKIFDGGIYGSPLNKEDIFSNLLQKNKINKTECLYIGDSEYDHISSAKFELDFIFLKKWSEFKNIDKYAFEKKINLIDDFKQLL